MEMLGQFRINPIRGAKSHSALTDALEQVLDEHNREVEQSASNCHHVFKPILCDLHDSPCVSEVLKHYGCEDMVSIYASHCVECGFVEFIQIRDLPCQYVPIINDSIAGSNLYMSKSLRIYDSEQDHGCENLISIFKHFTTYDTEENRIILNVSCFVCCKHCCRCVQVIESSPFEILLSDSFKHDDVKMFDDDLNKAFGDRFNTLSFAVHPGIQTDNSLLPRGEYYTWDNQNINSYIVKYVGYVMSNDERLKKYIIDAVNVDLFNVEMNECQ